MIMVIMKSLPLCRYRITPPPITIKVSIIMVRVAPEMASRTLDASLNRDMISPTFLVPKSEYEKIASMAQSKCPLDGDMFCYILDKHENKSRKIEQLAAEKRLTPFGMTLDSNVNIEQWLLSYSKAKYIVTDSYHGMVFALIFNKPFYVFENKFRGNERFKSIQETFGITNNEDNPDWDEINEIIRIETEKTLNYLKCIKQYE